MTDIDDQFTPDESEQLDQLEPERSLVDRNVDDALDEGYIAPDDWSPAEGFGNTAAEMREGETLDQRLKQEIPDPDPYDDDLADEHLDDQEVGDRRAGRLIDANQGLPGADTEAELIGEDVGIDGAAASAEEAAMHVVGESERDHR